MEQLKVVLHDHFNLAGVEVAKRGVFQVWALLHWWKDGETFSEKMIYNVW